MIVLAVCVPLSRIGTHVCHTNNIYGYMVNKGFELGEWSAKPIRKRLHGR